MRTRKIIGVSAIGIVGIFVVGGLVMSRTFSVTRTATVNAPVERVYSLAADLTKHPLWNARKSRDATMNISFPGEVHRGVGAVYEWRSAESGAGRCVILGAVPLKSLTIGVTLAGKGEGEATWHFAPSGVGTTVTRSFSGEIPMPILGPWILLFLHPEKSLGADFEQELQAFKGAAEGAVGRE